MSLNLPGPRPCTGPACNQHENEKEKTLSDFPPGHLQKALSLCLHHSSPSSFITALSRRWVSLWVTAALSHLELWLVWPTGPTYGGATMFHVVQGRKLNFNLVSYWGNRSKFPWQVVSELLKILGSFSLAMNNLLIKNNILQPELYIHCRF